MPTPLLLKTIITGKSYNSFNYSFINELQDQTKALILDELNTPIITNTPWRDFIKDEFLSFLMDENNQYITSE